MPIEDDVYVEVYDKRSGGVEERMGPMSVEDAARTRVGVRLVLNHDDFGVRIIPGDQGRELRDGLAARFPWIKDDPVGGFDAIEALALWIEEGYNHKPGVYACDLCGKWHKENETPCKDGARPVRNPDNSPTPSIDAGIPLAAISLPGRKFIDSTSQREKP